MPALFSLAGTAHAAVMINELDYDQPGTDNGEYVELLNNGPSSVSLDGYALRLVNGANNTTYHADITIPLGVTIAAGQHYVICGDASVVPACNLDVSPDSDLLQNGSPDAVALLLNGAIVDTLSYEGDVPGFTEGTGVPTASAENNASPNMSLSRCPIGSDSNGNATDFRSATPTPGATNACGVVGGTVGACGDPAIKISAIQGTGGTSPLLGQTVNVEAVVVGDFQDAPINGVFLQEQDPDWDGSPQSSEGLFIFEGTLAVPVTAGMLIRVRGTVAEVNTLTEITNTTDMVVCPGTPLVSTIQLSFPVSTTADLESYEGMLVSVSQVLTVTGNFEWGRFGSLDMSAGGRLFQPTSVVEPGMAAQVIQDLNLRSRVILDDASNLQNPNPIPYKDAQNTRRLGDTVGGLTGVLSGEFGAYRIHPTVPVTFAGANPRLPAPPSVGGRLRIAAVNVLNFFTTLDVGTPICGPTGGLDCRGANTPVEFNRQREKLLNELQALNPDLAGLMEIENNPSAAIQSLVDGLNARVGTGTYSFINTGTIGTDAIKLAVLFKVGTVKPINSFAVLTSAVDPAFIDTKNRPALAQTFEELSSRGRFTIVVNHLKSKGSACTDVGDPDMNDGQGNCNGTRTAAAGALLRWLAGDPTGSGDRDFMILGDLNAYAKEDPITTLKAGGFQALLETHLGASAYSFQFGGQSGYLDHALVTASLAAQVSGVAEWHINADEPVVVNYNTEFKTDDPFNAGDPFGASDHDPVLVGLNPTAPAAVPGVGPMGLAALVIMILSSGTISLRRRRGAP